MNDDDRSRISLLEYRVGLLEEATGKKNDKYDLSSAELVHVGNENIEFLGTDESEGTRRITFRWDKHEVTPMMHTGSTISIYDNGDYSWEMPKDKDTFLNGSRHADYIVKLIFHFVLISNKRNICTFLQTYVVRGWGENKKVPVQTGNVACVRDIFDLVDSGTTDLAVSWEQWRSN